MFLHPLLEKYEVRSQPMMLKGGIVVVEFCESEYVGILLTA